MSDNPYSPGKIGVTIKMPESKRYAADNPWFVFEAQDAETVKQRIVEAFDLENAESFSLAEVVVQAQALATAMGNASTVLGATPMKDAGAKDDSPPWSTDDKPKSDPWSKAGSAPAKEPVDPILAAIEAATTVAEVQTVWAENQQAFDANEAYMEAYRKKGLALS